MADDKKIKAAIKEGGKKGVDAVGISDMGGVSFFHLTVETPEGDWELISKVMEGMNAPVDEGAEERKGGAGGLGKMLLSAGKDSLIILCHVPAELAAAKGLDAKTWMETVLKPVGGEIIGQDGDNIKGEAKGNPEAGKFPLKMRDEASAAGFALLREKGLVPDQDSDDDFICDPEAAGIGEW